MSEFVEEPFVNDIGQKIEVGEDVVMFATSYKTTYFRRGTFKGVRYDNVTVTTYLRDENGKNIQEERQYPNGATYLVNKVERKTQRIVVAVVVLSNVGKIYQWVEGKYVKTEEDVYRTSTLPLKRIYKSSTPLHEIAGKSF